VSAAGAVVAVVSTTAGAGVTAAEESTVVVVAEESVVEVFSEPLLQATRVAAIAITPNTFFILLSGFS
jgi:hypothetical protein